jgi:hypothetical protein
MADKKILTPRELAISGVFGALVFVAVFILGSGVLLVTGIPATGGLVNMLVAIFLAVVGAKIIDKFGTITVMLTVTGIISIPTLSFGPPGLHKIPMMFLVGLIIDLVASVLKRENKGYIIGGSIAGFLAPIFIYSTLILLGLPGAEKLEPLLIPLMLVYAVLGLIGAYLGVTTYDKKLKHLSVVQSLKSKE